MSASNGASHNGDIVMGGDFDNNTGAAKATGPAEEF